MAVFSKQKLIQVEAAQAAQQGPRDKVMVVDDEESNRKVMAAILRPYYDLIEAKDGQEALQLIADMPDPETIACIVSDHRMPGLTGVELFVRVLPILPKTVRIIVTGFTDVDAIVDSINRAEIYRFILKPFDANDFLLTVRRAIEAVKLQRQLDAYHLGLEKKVLERTQELAEKQASLLEAYRVLQLSSARILSLYNNAACGYHTLDSAGVIIEINDTELAWMGWARDELVGKKTFAELISAHTREAFMARFPLAAARHWCLDFEDVEFELLRRDGGVIPVLMNATTHAEDGSSDSHCRFTAFNITERKESERRIRHLASHDPLTGLPNRSLLQDRVRRDLLHADRDGRKVALLFIDVDHFKQVNDTFGHHCGDLLLQQVAARLEACLRKSDTLGRLGGDEFVISLPGLADVSHAAVVAGKVVEVLAQTFRANDHELHVSASVGIGIYPDDARDFDALMRSADTAMYHAKEAGRNGYHFFGVADMSTDATVEQ